MNRLGPSEVYVTVTGGAADAAALAINGKTTPSATRTPNRTGTPPAPVSSARHVRAAPTKQPRLSRDPIIYLTSLLGAPHRANCRAVT
jgi:hypothetical protein